MCDEPAKLRNVRPFSAKELNAYALLYFGDMGGSTGSISVQDDGCGISRLFATAYQHCGEPERER